MTTRQHHSETLGTIKGGADVRTAPTAAEAWTEIEFVRAAAAGDVMAIRRHPTKRPARAAGDDEPEPLQPTLSMPVITAAHRAVVTAASCGSLSKDEASRLLTMIEWQRLARETAEYLTTLTGFIHGAGPTEGASA